MPAKIKSRRTPFAKFRELPEFAGPHAFAHQRTRRGGTQHSFGAGYYLMRVNAGREPRIASRGTREATTGTVVLPGRKA